VMVGGVSQSSQLTRCGAGLLLSHGKSNMSSA
jgi:hypothetical protein